MTKSQRARGLKSLCARGTRTVLGGALIVGLTGAALAMAGTTASASPGGSEYVNPAGSDSGSCRLPSTPCQTIAYALTVATPGTTIHAAAGSYPQQLIITQNVTISGAGSSSTSIDPSTLPNSYVESDTPGYVQYPEIYVSPGVTATLKNFNVDGANAQPFVEAFGSCATSFDGIYYPDSNGTISGVDVENINMGAGLFGCQSSLAVYVDAPSSVGPSAGPAVRTGRSLLAANRSAKRVSPLAVRPSRPAGGRLISAGPDATTAAVTMNDVVVTSYQKNGITCDDPGATCEIENSTVTGIGPTSLTAQNGVQGYDAGSLTLKGDFVTNNSYTGGYYGASGVLIYGGGAVSVKTTDASSNDLNVYAFNTDDGIVAPTNWTFQGDTAENSTLGDGIAIDSTTNTVNVTSNLHLSGNVGNGIALYGATGVTVSGNTANGNEVNGIYVGGPGSLGGNSTGNTVNHNKASNNSNDGILADVNTSGNVFTSNTMSNDTLYGAQDLSGGANTWTTNTCHPIHDSSPAGLC
jgi:parallel beta-helix repeat protein